MASRLLAGGAVNGHIDTTITTTIKCDYRVGGRGGAHNTRLKRKVTGAGGRLKRKVKIWKIIKKESKSY